MINRIREYYEETPEIRPADEPVGTARGATVDRPRPTSPWGVADLVRRNPGVTLIVAFTLGSVLGWWLKRK